jgi:hypothetical protein
MQQIRKPLIFNTIQPSSHRGFRGHSMDTGLDRSLTKNIVAGSPGSPLPQSARPPSFRAIRCRKAALASTTTGVACLALSRYFVFDASCAVVEASRAVVEASRAVVEANEASRRTACSCLVSKRPLSSPIFFRYSIKAHRSLRLSSSRSLFFLTRPRCRVISSSLDLRGLKGFIFSTPTTMIVDDDDYDDDKKKEEEEEEEEMLLLMMMMMMMMISSNGGHSGGALGPHRRCCTRTGHR